MRLPRDFPERQIVEFAARLRKCGLAVSPVEVGEAVRAAAAMPQFCLGEFRETLRLCLAKRIEDFPVFDREFDRYFLKEDVLCAAALRRWKEELRKDSADGDAADGKFAGPDKTSGESGGGTHRAGAACEPWRSALAEREGLPESFRAYAAGDELAAARAARRESGRTKSQRILDALWDLVEEGSISPEEYPRVLKFLERYAKLVAEVKKFYSGGSFSAAEEAGRKRRLEVEAVFSADAAARGGRVPDLPMASLTERQVRELQEHVREAAQRLYTRLVRLSGGHPRRLCFDYRQTIRKSLAAFGEPFWPVYRARKRRLRQLVTLCDVSGSMKYATRILLSFMYEVHQAFEGRARHFVFVGRLDEVTAFFGEDTFDECFAKVMRSADVDYYGYSDYGLAFQTFVQHFLDAVDSDTVVLVLGDARNNRKDPGVRHLEEICARAHASVWLNPEARGKWDTGDSVLSTYGKRVGRVVEVSRFGQLLRFVDELPAIVGSL